MLGMKGRAKSHGRLLKYEQKGKKCKNCKKFILGEGLGGSTSDLDAHAARNNRKGGSTAPRNHLHHSSPPCPHNLGSSCTGSGSSSPSVEERTGLTKSHLTHVVRRWKVGHAVWVGRRNRPMLRTVLTIFVPTGASRAFSLSLTVVALLGGSSKLSFAVRVLTLVARLAAFSLLKSNAEFGLLEVRQAPEFRLAVGKVAIIPFSALTLNYSLATLSF